MSRLFSGTPFDRPISCPKCHQAVADCRCLNLPDKKQTTGNPPHPNKKPTQKSTALVLSPKNAIPPADQIAKIHTEKRKGNRLVTVITGLHHPANDLPALCTALKQSLGTGGSVQTLNNQRVIELQGDHKQKTKDLLELDHGYKTRVV